MAAGSAGNKHMGHKLTDFQDYHKKIKYKKHQGANLN